MSNKPEQKIVVVIGGSGFLGSFVADVLSREGYRVRIFDKHPSPYLQPDQEMITGDILDQAALKQAFEGASYIYNFAGIADIDDAQDRPVETIQYNILGNTYALEAAKATKADRFIFASSIYVFSKSGSFYRASKQACEQIIKAYQEKYELDFTILRYGTLYGRRADSRNCIYRFIKEALTEQTITYNGHPDAVREYIHVEDAAELSVDILSQKYKNRHIILTGREKMPVKTLMTMLSEMLQNDKISCSFGDNAHYFAGHYSVTPYAIDLNIGHKLVSNDHIDIGQGLLDCIHEQLQENHPEIEKDIILTD